MYNDIWGWRYGKIPRFSPTPESSDTVITPIELTAWSLLYTFSGVCSAIKLQRRIYGGNVYQNGRNRSDIGRTWVSVNGVTWEAAKTTGRYMCFNLINTCSLQFFNPSLERFFGPWRSFGGYMNPRRLLFDCTLVKRYGWISKASTRVEH
jgi:hypothetical protein